MVTASWRATSAVDDGGAGVVVVVVVLVVAVVVLVVLVVVVDVVVVVGGLGHADVTVGNGGSPLSIAHVTVTVPPGT
jgi:hypothetical protein